MSPELKSAPAPAEEQGLPLSEAVNASLFMTTSARNEELRRPMFIMIDGEPLEMLPPRPWELFSSEWYDKLGQAYLYRGLEVHDIRFTLNPDISPIARYLVNYADLDEATAIIEQLRQPLRQFIIRELQGTLPESSYYETRRGYIRYLCQSIAIKITA